MVNDVDGWEEEDVVPYGDAVAVSLLHDYRTE
jgi:hypothetical protein